MTVKPKGRPATFSDTQLEKIKQAVSDDPENYGYHVWDGPTLSDYIKATYNIEYGTRACQKLFHRLGFSLIRPQTYPSLQNPDNEARDELKKTAKNERESGHYSGVSRRSTFSGTDKHYTDMGTQRLQAEGNVKTGKKQHRIQWFCYSCHRRTLCDETWLVQLRIRHTVFPRFHQIQPCTRWEEVLRYTG